MATKTKAKATKAKSPKAKSKVTPALKKPAGELVTVHVTFTRTDEVTVRLAPGQTVAELVAELEGGYTTVFERGTEIGYDLVGTVTAAETVDDEVHGVEVVE